MKQQERLDLDWSAHRIQEIASEALGQESPTFRDINYHCLKIKELAKNAK